MEHIGTQALELLKIVGTFHVVCCHEPYGVAESRLLHRTDSVAPTTGEQRVVLLGHGAAAKRPESVTELGVALAFVLPKLQGTIEKLEDRFPR